MKIDNKKLRRVGVTTVLLTIEYMLILIALVVVLGFMREGYSEKHLNLVGNRIASEISAKLWQSISLLANESRYFIADPSIENHKPYFVDNLRSTNDVQSVISSKRKFPLNKFQPLKIFIGIPKATLEHGFILPFAYTSSEEKGKAYYGDIKVPGIIDFLNGLAGENTYCRLSEINSGKTIIDTSKLPGDFRWDNLVKEFRTWQVAMPLFGLRLAIEYPTHLLDIPFLPQALVILFFIIFGAVLFFIHSRMIKPAAMAMDLIEKRKSMLDLEIPDEIDDDNIYVTSSSLITNYSKLLVTNKELEDMVSKGDADQQAILKRNHEELLIHHNVTKKMLKALNRQSVVPQMLDGVREMGHSDFLWGKFDRKSLELEFKLDPQYSGRGKILIPLMDDSFLLSKIFWNGVYQFVSDAGSLDLRYDDKILISDGPAFIVPVMKNRRFKCYQYFSCQKTDCPSYMDNDLKCWLRGGGNCNKEILSTGLKQREHCLRCPLFSVEGMLIVRSDGENILDHNSARGLVRLTNEASLALEVAELYEETERLSVTDGLTGLCNHREFYKLLAKEIERSRRYRTPISVLMIDIDNFKDYNDSFGHIAGDAALKAVSGGILTVTRKIDVVARYGGEEFVVILPETDQSGAVVLAERIKSEIEIINFSPHEGERVDLTVSIGICSDPESGLSPDDIVKKADDASYMAKRTGKNRICISDGI